MPGDPFSLIAGLASGGSNLVDTGINAIMQSKNNQNNQRYATYMYDRQRADAITDWNRQNAYNNPSAQMERYKAAGLNPNLIYGQSNTAAPVRSSSPMSVKREAPVSNIGGAVAQGLGAYQDSRIKQMQLDYNSKLQQLTDEKIKQTAVETIGKAITNSLLGKRSTKLDSEIDILKSKANILASTGMESATAMIEKNRAATGLMLSQTETQEVMRAPNFIAAVQKIALMRSQQLTNEAQVKEIQARVKNLGQDYLIKSFEVDLNRKGMSKGDPYYMRAIGKAVDALMSGGNLQDAMKLKAHPFTDWHGKINPDYDPKDPQSKMFLKKP
ncbi:DNA pilot protein [Blackfly microvirus SF02]|uniref:DNA pilot protein n=1 Tax=Blackfly microvirus SF02 TaxID=2576452 RepID=A0A4V1F5I0_9VIRU|nr:DNA pilot protein [Blackfly microvirus SF02]